MFARFVFGFQQIHRQSGDERPGENVGSEDGEDHGFGKRHKKVAGDSAQKEHREKHDADAKRGNERRHRDLRRAFQNPIVQALSVLEVALDVLDGYSGIVHQDADGEREAAQRHDVDGFAERAEDQDRRQHGSGIETAMISVLRQLPRKIRIIRPVRHAAMTPSRMTPFTAARTKID